jgi:hypothetical protein
MRFLRGLPRVAQHACLGATRRQIRRHGGIALQNVVDLSVRLDRRQVHRQVQRCPLSPLAIHRCRAVGLRRPAEDSQDRPCSDQHLAIAGHRLEGLRRRSLAVDDLVVSLRANRLACRRPGGGVVAAGAELTKGHRLRGGVVIVLVTLHLRFLPDRPSVGHISNTPSHHPTQARVTGRNLRTLRTHRHSDSVRPLTYPNIGQTSRRS